MSTIRSRRLTALPPTIPERSDRFVSTFSIVGRDAETGDLGIAVQSKFLGWGRLYPGRKLAWRLSPRNPGQTPAMDQRDWNCWRKDTLPLKQSPR